MVCYSPWVGFYDKTNSKVHYLGKCAGRDPIKEASEIWKRNARVEKYGPENMLLLPCGRCLGCRLEYSKEWANRCSLEAKTTHDNWFITLTYDEEYIQETFKPVIDKETGEYMQMANLVPEHITKFLKNLRRQEEYHHNNKEVRFYGCGEYGSINMRPHYHLIVFNLPLFDLVEEWRKDGFITYSSEYLSGIWKKGFLTINEYSWETAAYTARYMLKKLKGREAIEQYQQCGLEREFSRCSRNPGIGYEYYRQHRDEIYRTDSVIIHGQTTKPPKYFDKMYQIEKPEEWRKIQEKRAEASREEMKNKLFNTSINYQDQLNVEREYREEKIKMLGRNMEL